MTSLENMNAKVTFTPNLFRNHISAVEVCGIEFHIRKGFLSWKIFSPQLYQIRKITHIDPHCMGQILSPQRERFTPHDHLPKNGK